MIRILLASLFILFSSCKDRNKCPRNFLLPIEVSPAKLEYKIGDTLTLKSTFNKFVKGYSLQWEELESFDMNGINWRPATSIVQIDTLGLAGTSDITSNFQFIKDNNFNYDIFTSSSGNSILNGSFSRDGDNFSLEFKLIVRKIGIYLLQQTGLVELSIDNQEFPGKCNNSSISAYFEMNNREQVNFDLLSESPDPFFNEKIVNDAEDRFYRKGGFCFIVTE